MLQGDELRSIRENAPVLAQAIAEEFGTLIAGLKALGAEGELTAERVFRGILKAQEEVERAFATTESTISDRLTVLGNSFTQFVGKLDDAFDITGKLTRGLQGMAATLDALGRGDWRGAMEAQGASAAELDLIFGNVTKKLETNKRLIAESTANLNEALDAVKEADAVLADQNATAMEINIAELKRQ